MSVLSEGSLPAYSVEKLRFRPKSENISLHGAGGKFWRGVRLKWASCAVAAPWSLSRQSSMSFSKGVLLAKIFEIKILEFFNRISPKQTPIGDLCQCSLRLRSSHSLQLARMFLMWIKLTYVQFAAIAASPTIDAPDDSLGEMELAWLAEMSGQQYGTMTNLRRNRAAGEAIVGRKHKK